MSKPASREFEHEHGILQALLAAYMKQLKEKPILTKACTSACTSGVGNLLSQLMVTRGTKPVNWRSVVAFSATGFVVVGPVMHHFYLFLEWLVPKTASNVAARKLIIERLMFTPSFMLLYLFALSVFEGQSVQVAIQRIRMLYWATLKMNWKVWTVIQYVNINYVPAQYRVLFGNLFSLLWNMYIGAKRA